MIGDSKIGGPGTTPPVPLPTKPVEPAATPAVPGAAQGKDHYERPPAGRGLGAAAPAGGPAADIREVTHGDDLLQLVRENPAVARQIAAGFAAQAGATLTEIERELAGARALCDQLAKERFSRKAIEASRRELRKQRVRLKMLRLSHQLAARKLALLQQIAGKLGDPRLDEEIDRILMEHDRLNTAWGKRHHLLAAGAALYADVADTPPHLSHVIKTEVRASGDSEQAGETLAEISPRRLLADLMARTLDGSKPQAPSATTTASTESALRGDLGPSVRNWGRFSGLVWDDEDEDPFFKP